MNPQVLIIHESEIIRQGIKTMLRQAFPFEVTLMNDPADIQVEDLAKLTFVFCDIEKGIMLKQGLDKLKNAPEVIRIGILDGMHQANSLIFQECIDINIEQGKLEALINAYFNGETKNNHKEGDLLTLREKDVLSLVAEGNTNKEIASKLFISTHTVISHRKNITEKTGIKSVSGLTIYAILNQLINTEHLDLDHLS